METLGRYEVLKHLASGGMAQVLLARASGIEGFERHVVIKRILRESAADDDAIKMFLDEARLAAVLHHANVVQVHDIGEANGEYFFTMEYVHGLDLRQLLTEISARGAEIPIEHVVTIVSSAAAGLHYAHEVRGPDRKPLGIVHRDVSPANIIVGYDGCVKVADFGIAKAALRSSETKSGTLKGKIAYMSPEQCLGEPVDRRSDVFALGIVLYELATVRRLFKGSSDFLTMSQIVSGKIEPPSVYRPDLPAELEAIILKALAASPADRYQSADELRLALERFGKRSSTNELADYIRQTFGERPVPWLDDDDAEMAIDIDFDGAAKGAAGLPPRLLTPPPGSLLARARRKAANPKGVQVVPAPVFAGDMPVTAVLAAPPALSSLVNVVGTAQPLPVPAAPTRVEPEGSNSAERVEEPAAMPRRKRTGLVVALGLALGCAAGAAAWVLNDREPKPAATETAAPTSTTPAPAPSAPTETRPAATAQASEATPPAAAPTTGERSPPIDAPRTAGEPAATATTVASAEPPTAAKPTKPRARVTKPKTAKARKPAAEATKTERKTGWDPTQLLPD